MLKEHNSNWFKLTESSTVGEYVHNCSQQPKFNQKELVCIVLDKDESLIGIVTLGDFVKNIDVSKEFFNSSILSIMNPSPEFITESSSRHEIESISSRHKFIPKVDDEGKFLGIFSSYDGSDKFTITNSLEASDENIVFIGEVGNNHNGSLKIGKKIIDAVEVSGAQVVKFQHRSMTNLYVNEESSTLGAEYVKDLVIKYGLEIKDLAKLFEYSKDAGLTVMCTPWDEVALKELEETNLVEAYKVASADATNLSLISKIIKTRKPIVISTGMTHNHEIEELINFLQEREANYALLHCNSAYPPPYEDLNLRYLETLKRISFAQVGYSGHERGHHCVHAAISLGARIIEKHITIDNKMEGSDHKVSLLPEEFKTMVESSNEVLESLGSNVFRTMSQGEKINRVALGKSAFSTKKLNKGDILKMTDVTFLSPGDGLQPNQVGKYFGKKIYNSLDKGKMVLPFNFDQDREFNQSFSFKRKWGVPVRHRDVKEFSKIFNSPILEVHFSYNDLSLDHKKYFEDKFGKELVFHAPELFENDYIIDLTFSKNQSSKSFECLQRTIDAALEIKNLQNINDSVPIILNCGGFSEFNFLSTDDRKQKSDNLINNLLAFKSDEYHILPQTMPPFPWHFGGKRFHNIFTDFENIQYITKNSENRICLDLSHTAMFCNYKDIDLYDFVGSISQLVEHMHISDCKGVSDEGLQIGEGSIDFDNVANRLNDFGDSFILEIWQGHEDMGKGFSTAFKRLENKL
tara:strand:+ start:5688 stop:7928 length:2241 start_codon:yes stop_codon:yes gene_type:complete